MLKKKKLITFQLMFNHQVQELAFNHINFSQVQNYNRKLLKKITINESQITTIANLTMPMQVSKFKHNVFYILKGY